MSKEQNPNAYYTSIMIKIFSAVSALLFFAPIYTLAVTNSFIQSDIDFSALNLAAGIHYMAYNYFVFRPAFLLVALPVAAFIISIAAHGTKTEAIASMAAPAASLVLLIVMGGQTVLDHGYILAPHIFGLVCYYIVNALFMLMGILQVKYTGKRKSVPEEQAAEG